MSDERIELDITLRDQASSKLDDIAEKVDDLETADPEITVEADTAAAETDLKDVDQLAERLTAEDHKIILKAQIDQAKAELKELDTTIGGLSEPVGKFTEDTGKAGDAMHGFVGEAITELPGIGPAIGPASEAVGQLTEGLLAGEVAMGSLVTAAIPIAAIVVAVNAVTTALEQQKKIDAFNAEQVKEFRDAIEDAGDETEGLVNHLREARKIEFVQRSGDVKDVTEDLHKLNLSVEDFVHLVTDPTAFATFKANAETLEPSLQGVTETIGSMGPAVDNLKASFAESSPVGAAYVDVIAAINTASGNLEKQQIETALADAVFGKSAVDAARDADKTKRALDNVTTASDNTRDAIDRLRGRLNFETESANLQTELTDALNGVVNLGVNPTIEQIRQLKLDYIDVADTAGKTPIEIESTLRSIDQGDYLTVLAQVQQMSKLNPILLATALADPMMSRTTGGGRGGGVVPTAVQSVTVNLPRGYRGDVVREVTGASRRNGRRYGAQAVRYARR
jgi:hypothetical protein